MRWRPKPAYDTTVETSIYCAPESVGQGLGGKLYAALFDAIAGENIHRIVAGYVPPNSASAALHERFGFRPVGTFSEVAISSAATGMCAGWKSGCRRVTLGSHQAFCLPRVLCVFLATVDPARWRLW